MTVKRIFFPLRAIFSAGTSGFSSSTRSSASVATTLPSERSFTPVSDWSRESAQLSRRGAYLVVAMSCDRPAIPFGARYSLVDLHDAYIGYGRELEKRPWKAHRSTPFIRLPDPKVSRTHAHLYIRNGAWCIEDSRSTNGTWLNGQRVDWGPLTDGDVISLGHTVLVFRQNQQPGRTVDRQDATSNDVAEQLAPFPPTFSVPLRDAYLGLGRVADTTTPIVLNAEPGLGRVRIAQAIHESSGREGRWIRLGAAEAQAGNLQLVLTAADRGTLYVEEIAEWNHAAQAHFVDAWLGSHSLVSSGRADAGIIVGSRRSLSKMAADGTVREDLARLLAGLRVRIPPLRERREDMGFAIAEVLRELGADDSTIRPLAAAALFRNPWPGNLDELRGALRHMIQCTKRRMINVEGVRPWASALMTLREALARYWQIVADRGESGASKKFCTLVDGDGALAISESQYHEIIARRRDYDLLIDLVEPLGRGRWMVVKRDEGGEAVELALEYKGVAALARLVERRVPLRPAEMESLDVEQPCRLIERARAGADVRVGRYQWRSFHTLTELGERDKRYVFRPPAGFRYAVLRPLD